jgi:hypothetical protein
VRVNPAIEVDIELTAGSLNVTGRALPGARPGDRGRHGRQQGRAARSPMSLVQAGSGTVEGPINTGRSRLKIESGSLTVALEKPARR